MHWIHYLSLGVNLINVFILLLLLYVYTKNYRYIKSKYNLGLLVFSLLFLIENLIIIHLGIFSWPTTIDDIVMTHMIIIDSIELIGLLVLLYITWK
jgi:hypothetical protein